MPTFEITLPDGRTVDVDGPDANIAAQGAVQWAKSNPAPRKKGGVERAMEATTGFMANVNRGLGIGDEIAAAGNTAAGVAQGKIPLNALWSGYKQELANQRQIEDQFATQHPNMAAIGRGTGMAVTSALPMGQTLSTSNALMAGARTATAAGAQAYGYGLADRGTGQERLDNANRAVVPAMVIGGALGAGGQMLANRATRKAAQTETEKAAELLRQRAKADPNAMAAKADQMRSVGVEPNALDVIGQKGERVVRAAGARYDDAGEALTENAMRVSADTKPGAMSAARGIVDDPRTATQYVDDLKTARSEAATTNYAGPYAQPVQIDADTAGALRGDAGRAAIQRARQAAAARQDYAQMQELDGLLASNMEELPTVSAGTLHRVKIALSERAQTASRRGANDLASGYRGRQGQVERALENVDGLAEANADFRAKSQAIGVLEKDRLDIFDSDPKDYARWVQTLGPEARQANAVAIRQDVLDAIGGTRQSSLGSLDTLATSQYARDNLRTALGDDVADGLIANIKTRVAQTRRATNVTPGAGSRTEILRGDVERLDSALQVADVAQKGLRGDVMGVAQATANWFRSRGVSEEQANALVASVTRPEQLDNLVAEIARQSGPNEARSFLETFSRAFADDPPADAQIAAVAQRASALLSRPAAVGVAAPKAAVEAWTPDAPQYGVGRAY